MKRIAAICVVMVVSLGACGDDADPVDSSAGQAPSAGVTTTTSAMSHGSGGEHADHMGNPTADCAPSGTALAITASGTQFDKNCLAAPASQSFTISYDSKDSASHNIAILESHTATEVLYRAEIFQGPKVETLRVSALKPGTYAFHCEVHPSRMSGTFVVK